MWRSGLAEQNNAALRTLPPELMSGTAFATAHIFDSFCQQDVASHCEQQILLSWPN